MEKTIIFLVLTVFLAVVSSQEQVPITVYDSSGQIVSQDNGDGVFTNFNPEIIPSEEAPLFFDPSGEDASLSYSAPQEEEEGVEIPQNTSGGLS